LNFQAAITGYSGLNRTHIEQLLRAAGIPIDRPASNSNGPNALPATSDPTSVD